MAGELVIRAAREEDAAALLQIYEPYVMNTAVTFEFEVPTVAEFAGRIRNTLARYPYFVAELDGEIVGYAYASAYRPRPAYRFAVENSVYVAPGAGRSGTGQALLEALIDRCTARGFRLMVAVIGDSANAASIGLHARAGFARAGLIPAVGWKHGRWVDSVLMTRPLGAGATTPPDGE